MRALRGRSGSALIIVLGFLSFMVVSAVAFAVYMRTERLASSGFHRSASVRQMVKAGVANVIAQIDAAIGDDPYPGLQMGGSSGGDFGLNHWRNCLFMPYKYAPADETVPVIPLEGLAYLAVGALARREVALLESEHIAAKPIPVEMHVRALHQRIMNRKKMRFSEMVDENTPTPIVVVTFLALLELYKRAMVVVSQDGQFGDIEIEYLEGSGELIFDGEEE